MGVTSHHCYHILLVKSKSQVLPVLKGRGLNKGVNTKGRGSLKVTLESIHPSPIPSTCKILSSPSQGSYYSILLWHPNITSDQRSISPHLNLVQVKMTILGVIHQVQLLGHNFSPSVKLKSKLSASNSLQLESLFRECGD